MGGVCLPALVGFFPKLRLSARASVFSPSFPPLPSFLARFASFFSFFFCFFSFFFCFLLLRSSSSVEDDDDDDEELEEDITTPGYRTAKFNYRMRTVHVRSVHDPYM